MAAAQFASILKVDSRDGRSLNAWNDESFVKWNAIMLTKNGVTVSADQMSRV